MSEWKPENVPNCFYRVTVKGLILNKEKDKFLIMREDNGTWEIPGGGLDFGERPHIGLKREIAEEMHLEVTSIVEHPSYFLTGTKSRKGYWNVAIVYEAELENLDFTPTEECEEIKFIGKEDTGWLENARVGDNVTALFEVFDPKNH